MNLDDRQGRALTALRVVGLLAVVASVALLVYGVVGQAPDTTLADGIAEGEPATAPDFELDLLQMGKVPRALEPTFRRAGEDGRVALWRAAADPMIRATAAARRETKPGRT